MRRTHTDKHYVALIQRRLLRWYRRHARPLPWRRTKNPYRILVSEVMLQQTQVSRVLQKYPDFLRRFPTLQRLAASSPADVIRAWQGMGYNNRALNLHRLARLAAERYHGRLPGTPDDLIGLPGIGRYTANAVACFAFGASVATVDTNVRRVLSRVFPARLNADPWLVAERVLPKRSAYDWNQGLMELGALICTAKDPACGECPLVVHCPSAHRIVPALRVKSTERTRRSVPDRIYRGRVVEVLRSSRRSVSIISLRKSVIPDLASSERKWFAQILDRLERDGMIRVTRKNGDLRVSLPE
ncbi:MAG: A/G-specific adenine glycosylase [Bacteroidetes bacterium]|jgi:A/G-specific adenine glycosylase|nr:A/G-specific adenine glycosylase [Bacteroidota bacterium]